MSLGHAWYMTPEAYADRKRCHVDALLYVFDAGAAPAVVRVPKAHLLEDLPGPCAYVQVEVPEWHALTWSQDGDDRVAQLAGEHVAWEVVGDELRTHSIPCDGVVIRRSQLVVSLDAQDIIDQRTETARINGTERNTFLLVVGWLARNEMRESGRARYTLAKDIVADLKGNAIQGGWQTIADKMKEGLALLPEERETA